MDQEAAYIAKYEADHKLIEDFLRALEQRGYVICERDVRRHATYEGHYIPITTYNDQALVSLIGAFWQERADADEATRIGPG